MTAAERVREICKGKGIAIYQLEKDLGFANAYISRIKKDSLPYDRAKKIADYLDVTVDYILTGENPEEDEITQRERQLLDQYRSLTAYQKKIIDDTVKSLEREKRKRQFRIIKGGT